MSSVLDSLTELGNTYLQLKYLPKPPAYVPPPAPVPSPAASAQGAPIIPGAPSPSTPGPVPISSLSANSLARNPLTWVAVGLGLLVVVMVARG